MNELKTRPHGAAFATAQRLFSVERPVSRRVCRLLHGVERRFMVVWKTDGRGDVACRLVELLGRRADRRYREAERLHRRGRRSRRPADRSVLPGTERRDPEFPVTRRNRNEHGHSRASIWRERRGGAVVQRVRHLGLRSVGRGFKSCWRQRCVTTLGKSFTPMCLCHQAV